VCVGTDEPQLGEPEPKRSQASLSKGVIGEKLSLKGNRLVFQYTHCLQFGFMNLLLPLPKPGVKALYLMKILRNECPYY
jgi:hypothetical protein